MPDLEAKKHLNLQMLTISIRLKKSECLIWKLSELFRICVLAEFMCSPFLQDALEMILNQGLELREDRRKLTEDQSDQQKAESDLAEQRREVLEVGEKQRQVQEELDEEGAALAKKAIELERNFAQKESDLKRDFDRRELELKRDLLKFRREKAYEKYKNTSPRAERYKPKEEDLVPACRICAKIPDQPSSKQLKHEKSASSGSSSSSSSGSSSDKIRTRVSLHSHATSPLRSPRFQRFRSLFK